MGDGDQAMGPPPDAPLEEKSDSEEDDFKLDDSDENRLKKDDAGNQAQQYVDERSLMLDEVKQPKRSNAKSPAKQKERISDSRQYKNDQD